MRSTVSGVLTGAGGYRLRTPDDPATAPSSSPWECPEELPPPGRIERLLTGELDPEQPSSSAPGPAGTAADEWIALSAELDALLAAVPRQPVREPDELAVPPVEAPQVAVLEQQDLLAGDPLVAARERALDDVRDLSAQEARLLARRVARWGRVRWSV